MGRRSEMGRGVTYLRIPQKPSPPAAACPSPAKSQTALDSCVLHCRVRMGLGSEEYNTHTYIYIYIYIHTYMLDSCSLHCRLRMGRMSEEGRSAGFVYVAL